MTTSSARVVLYRYGPVRWVWRVLLGLLGFGAAAALLTAPTSWEVWLVMAPLVAPAAFFGWVVVAAIDRDGDRLRIVTLCGLVRRVDPARLGIPIRRTRAYASGTMVHAPRLWVPVRRGLPLHIDLMGAIPERRAFEAVFGAVPR